MSRRLLSCSRACMTGGVSCKEEHCRHWINYSEDHNCSLISIYKNGSMTLHQVGERLGVSFVRVSQIEKKALKKLKKTI